MREVYISCWNICKSAALVGSIDFLRIEGLDPNGVQVKMNNKKALGYTYVILPAGDVDVVERNEKVNNIAMVWPYTMNYPMLQGLLLKEMLQSLFIEDAEQYIRAIDQTMMPNEKEGVRQILDTLVNADPNEVGSIVQEIAPDMQNLVNNLATQPTNNG